MKTALTRWFREGLEVCPSIDVPECLTLKNFQGPSSKDEAILQQGSRQ
jgi:hypothetical protein